MTQQDISALTTMLTDMQTPLQGEFDKINERLDGHHERFKQIGSRFNRFEARIERVEDDMRVGFDRVNTTLDGIVSRLDDDYTERTALTAQVDRHERWVIDAAPIVDVEYTPGAQLILGSRPERVRSTHSIPGTAAPRTQDSEFLRQPRPRLGVVTLPPKMASIALCLVWASRSISARTAPAR
jgi:hypothetical protein